MASSSSSNALHYNDTVGHVLLVVAMAGVSVACHRVVGRSGVPLEDGICGLILVQL